MTQTVPDTALSEQQPDDTEDYVRCHLLFAWWSLLCFLTLGITLEALHAFKVGWYLEPDVSTRRLMWTLGHAHGALLALVHVAFAVTVFVFSNKIKRWRHLASPCLLAASLLLPGGFFIGGISINDGDRGVGVFLLPVGAICLFAAVLMTSWEMTTSFKSAEDSVTEDTTTIETTTVNESQEQDAFRSGDATGQ